MAAIPQWPYQFNGGRQPYAPPLGVASTLPPPVVNDPPFRHPSRTAQQQAVAVQFWQPEAWPFAYLGGKQPYSSRKLNPTTMDVPVNDPPFDRRIAENRSTIVAQWRADLWPPVFMGGKQAYEGRKLPATLIDVPVNDPPFSSSGRSVNAGIVVTMWRPDPWVYDFMGGRGPFVSRKLAPGTPGSSVDNPPFTMVGRLAQIMSTLLQWQPPVWPYVFMGGKQPYQRGNLPPVITNIPIPVNYRLVIRNQTVRLDNVIRGPGNVTNYPNGREES